MYVYVSNDVECGAHSNDYIPATPPTSGRSIECPLCGLRHEALEAQTPFPAAPVADAPSLQTAHSDLRARKEAQKHQGGIELAVQLCKPRARHIGGLYSQSTL